DLSDPPAEARRRQSLGGLTTAIADNDRQRIARETARLVRAGFDAKEAVVHAFRICNERLEDGMTHAHAAAADWLVLAERAASPDTQLAAVLEPLGHIAWDTEGAGRSPYAAANSPWNARAFLAAIEAEDEAAAVGLVRGALADG